MSLPPTPQSLPPPAIPEDLDIALHKELSLTTDLFPFSQIINLPLYGFALETLLITDLTPATILRQNPNGTIHCLYQGKHIWTKENDQADFIHIPNKDTFKKLCNEAEKYGTITIIQSTWGELINQAQKILTSSKPFTPSPHPPTTLTGYN
ncbi:hypothetical protein RSAG8_11442, partial [Rhizoctonia solani AG-8 WAC10335]